MPERGENQLNKAQASFTGKTCCLFDFDDAQTAYDHMEMEFVFFYGAAYYNPKGRLEHYLHTWDEGARSLVKCKKCGAFFLVQDSEYHGREDSYYTDWYQVEGEKEAERLNAMFDGYALESRYHAPWIKKTNSVLTWSKGKSSS